MFFFSKFERKKKKNIIDYNNENKLVLSYGKDAFKWKIVTLSAMEEQPQNPLVETSNYFVMNYILILVYNYS